MTDLTRIGALGALRSRWSLVIVIFVPLLGALLSLVYLGGALAPAENTRDLPIAVVNEDRATGTAPDTPTAAEQVAGGVTGIPALRAKVSWYTLGRAEAERRMERGGISATVVVPRGFSRSVGELAAAAARPGAVVKAWPSVQILTNPRAGSMESALGQSLATQSVAALSAQLGSQLADEVTAAAHEPLGPTARALLKDPVRTEATAFRPVEEHSGLGLGPFYYAIVLIMAGFLGANVVNSILDTSLGYQPSEFGPVRKVTPQAPISRTQTLLAKMTATAASGAVAGTAALLVARYVLDMDTPHLPQLWLFSVCTVAVIGVSVQVLYAALGPSFGILASSFFFIIMGLPTSGGAISLHAVPDAYRAVAEFIPMRHVTDGVRAIVFYDAIGAAGLARAWLMLAVGLAVALAVGFAITSYYDRAGFRRSFPPKPDPENAAGSAPVSA
ncbi:ABC transporter permease [Streptomyces sp. RKCA744]|uniref:ABC transporter permease n=1 Tax=Streptomyces sp. RKCA744 TaxID=2959340 RepID=UPI00209EF346|nr:ABC transporter permease [Streptomyces sp. RKCA744]MCO8308813.1 DUF3533 domain-containing protein [Streptomyces sp. RKCA744]